MSRFITSGSEHMYRRSAWFLESEVWRNPVVPVCARHHQQDGAVNRGHKQTDLIIMDFAKAFDKVPHRRLLHKLDYYGIRGSTHKWINSWLSGRTQQVVLDGQASDPVPVLDGVPKVSVLGPILFLIFINDLPDNIRSSVRLFTDDCVLYMNIY